MTKSSLSLAVAALFISTALPAIAGTHGVERQPVAVAPARESRYRVARSSRACRWVIYPVCRTRDGQRFCENAKKWICGD